MMKVAEVKQKIIRLLERQAGSSSKCFHDDDFNFVQQSHLDSFALLSFLTEIEEEFQIEIDPEELAGPDSQTIGGLSQLIHHQIC